MGTVGLVTVEVSLIIAIARTYGEQLTSNEIKAFASTIGVGSLALRHWVREFLNFVPVAGWLVKGGLALATIKAIGVTTIAHFERRFPERPYASDN